MKHLVLAIGLTLAFLGANAQTSNLELVGSAGDSFSNTSYQLDWSIGESVTATHNAGDYVITQGFHQNSYIITAVENLRAEIEISIYPNPTSDFISLNFAKVQNFSKVDYTITDFSGKVLQTNNLTRDIEQINFSAYAAGTYLISVSGNKKLIKSFTIIKN